jgi:N-acyl-D-amino-acid deacylase
MVLDILIRGARVFDGLGNPGVVLDVGIQADKVVALGTAARPTLAQVAKVVIEGQGLALMPGIVDNHTHYDAQVTWDSACSPSPQMGVTTGMSSCVI